MQPQDNAGKAVGSALLLSRASIEVTPRTLSRLADPAAVLRPGTTVFIACIGGTPFADMLATAQRLRDAGLEPVPHIPARFIADHATLADMLERYRDQAGVGQTLLLAGGKDQPIGAFSSSMDLVETGLFDRLGYHHLNFAGHPEGNRDIDPDGGSRIADEALRWKSDFVERSDLAATLVTQFVFDAAPVIAWERRLRAAGVDLPIAVGLAGPARLQNLIRFAMDCGVGSSLRVLQRRARDIRKLLQPVTPDSIIAELEAHQRATPDSLLARVHLYPFSGIEACADWWRGALPAIAA